MPSLLLDDREDSNDDDDDDTMSQNNAEQQPQVYLNPIQKIAAALRAVLASPADARVLEGAREVMKEWDALAEVHMTIQEGGAGEYHISATPSEHEADDFRRSCDASAYRTSGTWVIPAWLAAAGEDLYELLEEVAGAEYGYSGLEAEDEDEDEAEEERAA